MLATVTRPPSNRDPLPGRTEPHWGEAGDLEFRDAAPPPQQRHRARATGRQLLCNGRAWLLAAALLMVVTGAVLRRPLGDWLWPETRAQALRDAAAQALARGHLSAADGSGARELYEAAIAIDPDRAEARSGLVAVGRAALRQAEAALRQQRFALAHRHLALARELSVPRAETDAFAQRLREREAGAAGIDHLLAQAAQARAEGRLDGDDGAALPLYRRVLALQPERVEALEGREDALTEYLQQAWRLLRRDEVAEAARIVDAAAGYDRGHADLPDLRAELNRVLEALRARAARDLRRGALERAASAYATLREVDPEDPAALQGRAALARAWAGRAERAAADFDFAAAEQALGRARAQDPESAAIAQARRRIADSRKAQARLEAGVASATPGRADPRRVERLLREAAEAEARGDLVAPPGESAFDKLRAARALAPDDAAVRRAQQRLAPAARQCFERELPRNDLGRARGCLDAWTMVEGGSDAVRLARRRLARRWLAVGDERLGAGELAAAAAALRQAEAIDAGVPGLRDFRERLRTANALGD